MLTVHVGPSDRLRAAAADLRATPERIEVAVIGELQTIPAGLRPRVQAEMGRVLPARYAPVLATALQVTATTSRSGWIRTRIRASARGRRQLRDLATIDTRGALRHPVYGHARVWATTQVRPGVWTQPVDAYTPQIIAGVDAALGRVADWLERG